MTSALLTAFWFSVGGYVLAIGAMAWRTARPRPVPHVADDALPSVAVIVAARDEELTLPRCLTALSAQDYPAGRIEIIVADDHSEDGTEAAVRRFEHAGALSPADRPADTSVAGPADGLAAGPVAVRYLRVPDSTGHIRGKALALHSAIGTTDAEVLLFTDADCAPDPRWARELAEPFADGGTDLVCSLTAIDPYRGLGDHVQALDWALMLVAVGAITEAGLPATGMGNNMAVRQSAYHATGGYPALPFSVTEDFTLFRAVADRPGATARFRLSPRAAVLTHPAATFRGAYEQRRRWASGGLGGGWPVWLTYTALWMVHALPLAALVLDPLAGAAGLAAMTAADAALLTTANRRAGGILSRSLTLPALVGSTLFRTAYLVTLPAVLTLRPRIVWKGRMHEPARRRRAECEQTRDLP